MKNTVDFFKIDSGKLGAINFNNMIPVTSSNYKIIYFAKISMNLSDKKYYELLKDQLFWLNKYYVQVVNKSSKLYNLYNNGKLNKIIMDRCCNFKLLEEKCIIYDDVNEKVGV